MKLTRSILILCTAAFMFFGCESSDDEDGTCTDGDKTYKVGDIFPAADGCNTCQCNDGGGISCTQLGCVATCEYDGKTYSQGDSFPATDGCNTCTCGEDGGVGCTEIGCPPYNPCTGKSCGDTCQTCDPNNKECIETAEEKACNKAGECTSDNAELQAECSDTGMCTVGADQCLEDGDCNDNGEWCGVPGQSAGCGACFSEPNECDGDADCKSQGDHFVCDSDPCACGDPGGDGNTCSAGCQADSECKAWQSCESGRCNAKACGSEDDCPGNFNCTDSKCTRLECGENQACQGCCVHGKCYSEPGSCLISPP